MMTEEEAEAHACCSGSDRPAENGPCIGSKCMAWRWSRAKETQAFLDATKQRMKDEGENFAKASQHVYAKVGSHFEKTEGYCGLAGRPE